MITKIKKTATWMLCAALFAMNCTMVTSCKEDIDESNLYTFTGETIEDYLTNRSEKFSSFNYILSRIGYDKILAAYGTYTCFAPTNEAVDEYLDSLYNDPVNLEIPHNGMTKPGLEGLTDSLCEDIALFHLLNTKIMGVDMSASRTLNTLLGRDINTSIDPETGAMLVSRASTITSMDNELENGVLHEIDCVIRRSNMLIAGELENHPEDFTLFSQAMKLTGLADSLTEVKSTDFVKVGNPDFWTPKERMLGYTIFAESDQVLAEHGITSIEDLKAYADSVYAHCADQGTGWYDYPRNHHIEVSTGTDYKNPWNTLSMFMRYHILECKIAYDMLVRKGVGNETSKMPYVEYYETMLPYTMLKISRVGGKELLNRWVANNSLTDQIADLGSAAMHTVLFNGIELQGTKAQIQALNGYIHPVKEMLAYEKRVPQGALNERIRIDDTALFGEMMSTNLRGCTEDWVKAQNGGKGGTSTDRHNGCGYIRIPPGFFKYMAIYNGDDTRFLYFPHYGDGWSNYQGDEFNCMGNYDFAFRLPPMPDGTYELRIGYTTENERGMLQFYLGTSSDLSTMKALDIPVDMRIKPAKNSNGTPDVITGWCDWELFEDKGIESDGNMRNLGYMRGPLSYNFQGKVARSHNQDLRRIITKQEFKQGEYWLRCKSVIDMKNAEFHLDYIEFCPENVYNNTRYLEDMY
ncbi:MAG: fasciclin domain-containing protein [Prevotella sp.]|nr:fasciclin domain-containing protein [Prevotella sp.]